MKKLIALFSFAVVMLMGVQSVSAQSLSQDKSRPEVIAKADTAKLVDALGLSDDQGRAVFRALVAKEVSYQKIGANKNANDSAGSVEKKKIDSQLSEAMKKTLNEKQYAKWQSMN